MWRMATSIQKARRASSAMASGDGGSGAVVVAEIVRGQVARIHLRSTFPQPCGGGATRPHSSVGSSAGLRFASRTYVFHQRLRSEPRCVRENAVADHEVRPDLHEYRRSLLDCHLPARVGLRSVGARSEPPAPEGAPRGRWGHWRQSVQMGRLRRQGLRVPFVSVQVRVIQLGSACT